MYHHYHHQHQHHHAIWIFKPTNLFLGFLQLSWTLRSLHLSTSHSTSPLVSITSRALHVRLSFQLVDINFTDRILKPKIFMMLISLTGPGNSAITVNKLRSERPRNCLPIIDRGKKISSCPKRPDRLWGLPVRQFSGHSGFFPGVKAAWSWSSLLSSISLPRLRMRGV
jgi:hypothetical protein